MVRGAVQRYRQPVARMGAGALAYQAGRLGYQLIRRGFQRGMPTRTRQSGSYRRPRHLVRRMGVYKSKYKARRRRRKTVADKALANIGFQRAYHQEASRETSNNGKQALRLMSKGLTDYKLYTMLKAVNPSFFPDLNNYMCHIKGMYKKIMITNATNNQTVVYVYEMMSKRDTSTDLDSDADTGDDKMATGDLLPLDQDNVAYTPLSAPKVFKNWRKIKTFKKIMDPGAVWCINIKIPMNKRFNTTNMRNSQLETNQAPRIPFNHRGLTSQTLVRWHGTPASRTNEEGTVTLAPSRIEYTVAEYYTYKHVNNMRNQTELLKAFNTEPGTMDIINDETATPTTVTTA